MNNSINKKKPNNQMRELVLFDLDHTLLTGDSDYQWTDFLVEQNILDESARERKDKFFQQYKNGTLDINEYLRFQLEVLRRYPRDVLDGLRQDFMKERILPMVTPAARALVAPSLIRLSLVAVVTATNQFVTEHIPALFGIQHLVATQPKIVDGQYTGEVEGVPCYREGKIACTEKWLQGMGLSWDDFDSIRCYSDSHNDLPLLRKATYAVAVNPDQSLALEAYKQQWSIIYMQQPD